MEKKYSLLQRITSDTPLFFKWLQRFGLGLTILGTELMHLQTLPQQWCTALVSIGGTLAVVCQFAVKQYEPVNTNKP
ncbi:hypothetical protein GCM10027037_14890 [Mucilaginibacter koreensis]